MKNLLSKTLLILVGLLAWVSLTPKAHASPIPLDDNDYLEFTIPPDSVLEFYLPNNPETQHIKLGAHTRVSLVKQERYSNKVVGMAFTITPLDNQTYAIEVEDFDSHHFELRLNISGPCQGNLCWATTYEVDPDIRTIAIKSQKVELIKPANNGGGIVLHQGQEILGELFAAVPDALEITFTPVVHQITSQEVDPTKTASLDEWNEDDAPTQVAGPSAPEAQNQFAGGGCSFNVNGTKGGPMDLMILILMGLGLLLPLKKKLL